MCGALSCNWYAQLQLINMHFKCNPNCCHMDSANVASSRLHSNALHVVWVVKNRTRTQSNNRTIESHWSMGSRNGTEWGGTGLDGSEVNCLGVRYDLRLSHEECHDLMGLSKLPSQPRSPVSNSCVGCTACGLIILLRTCRCDGQWDMRYGI